RRLRRVLPRLHVPRAAPRLARLRAALLRAAAPLRRVQDRPEPPRLLAPRQEVPPGRRQGAPRARAAPGAAPGRRGRAGGEGGAVTGVETVAHDGQTLAFVIRRDVAPEKTTFVTAGDATLQLGFIVYPAGATIARHVHREVERRVVGTPECIVVRS